MSGVTDEIKERVDLVELIGRSVPLKRVGTQFRGLCPFHAEKTPSFYVRPQTHSWHCFGCQRHGTAFDWIMERENLEFAEVLRMLAQQTGVTLPTRRAPEDDQYQQRLFSVLQHAQTFYEGMLWGTIGQGALKYLRGRGLNDETIRKFGIGFAPLGNKLGPHLSEQGFSEQEMQGAGVIGTGEDGHQYDFFRERVIFPIRDIHGRTIAFGGRSPDGGALPKYMNSRDTLLFHKQETLFAYDLARKTMMQLRQAVVVEGYVDAVMTHQAGQHNVVATLGTAVTEQHVRMLRRQVDDIVLALDSDAAGQAGTERALRVADESLRTSMTPVVGPNKRTQRVAPTREVQLRVLVLPAGQDPDDVVRSDPTAWPKLVQSALPVMEFILQRVVARHDLKSAGGRRAAADEIGEALAGIASPIEQDFYVQRSAEFLRADPRAVRRLVQQHANSMVPATHAALPAAQIEQDRDDAYMLALLVRMHELSQLSGSNGYQFMRPESAAIYRALGAELPPELEPYMSAVSKQLPLVRTLADEHLPREITQVQRRIRRRQLEHERESIRALGSDEAIREVADQLARITEAIRTLEAESD